MCEMLAAKLEQPQLIVPKGKGLNPKRVKMKPFVKERWCTENKWKPIRKFKKPVMSFVGCVHQTWRALHFYTKKLITFQQPCKFFKLLLSAFTWMSNRLIQGTLSYFSNLEHKIFWHCRRPCNCIYFRCSRGCPSSRSKVRFPFQTSSPNSSDIVDDLGIASW